MKPILKSLRSLSLAAQIDVRPCFTFNSIGQKTAIRWRDASDAGALCRRSRSRLKVPLERRDRSPLSFHSYGPPARYARGKGSLELSARGSADTKLSLSITRRRGLAAENERLPAPLSLSLSLLSLSPFSRNDSRQLPSQGESFKFKRSFKEINTNGKKYLYNVIYTESYNAHVKLEKWNKKCDMNTFTHKI